MATTWVEKKNILNKYNPKAWKKSGAKLGRSILCLQKKSVNIAKMAFLDDFASLTIFKVKKYHFEYFNDQNMPGQLGTSIIEPIFTKKSTSKILALTPP